MNRRQLRLAGLLLAALPVLSAVATPPTPIRSALQPFVDNGTLAGAVTLVASKEKVLSLEAVGYADLAAKKPMRTDCLFWIASQSKPITATALMMLVDEGKVSVDDPVEKHLPEFTNQWVAIEQDNDHVLLQRPRHPITVKNILTHTSGLPFKSAIEQPTLDLFPLAVRVQSYAMLPLQFEPDTKYQYSNAGINTAGRIVEVVSGMKFEEFLDKRLFRPLGMKDTTFTPGSAQLRRLAKAYKPAGPSGLQETTIHQLHYPLNDRIRQPMPAGGLFSTASDMCRFARMILNNGVSGGQRLLSEAAVKRMTSRQTPVAFKESYGFGFAVGDGWCGHGGAYSTNTTIDRERGLITIWLVQHAGFPGEGKKSQDAFKRTALEAFAQ